MQLLQRNAAGAPSVTSRRGPTSTVLYTGSLRALGVPPSSTSSRAVTRSSGSGSSAARRRSTVAVAASSNGSSLLPWQAAMDEVKKRRDLKSIMIIGAGPIVIGQVRTSTVC